MGLKFPNVYHTGRHIPSNVSLISNLCKFSLSSWDIRIFIYSWYKSLMGHDLKIFLSFFFYFFHFLKKVLQILKTCYMFLVNSVFLLCNAFCITSSFPGPKAYFVCNYLCALAFLILLLTLYVFPHSSFLITYVYNGFLIISIGLDFSFN